ncbi:MAG: PQQ-dependent sugar dehydrogenase [Planctomycetia bacterium]|nr:PQQ-dependent sugar dehydrogenase [Planctomycetia bacterium]
MSRVLGLLLVMLSVSSATFGQQPVKPLVAGLKDAVAVAVGAGGKVFIAVSGEAGKAGTGKVLVLEKDQAVPFADGFDDPRALAAHQDWLYVADKDRVWRIDRKGKADVYTPANAFPNPPSSLGKLTVDPESGTLFVADLGDLKGKGAAIYRIPPKGKVAVVTDGQRWPGLHTPRGLVLDGQSHLLVVDESSGELHRVKVADGKAEKVASGLGSGDDLAWDMFGRLFIADAKNGKLFAIPRPGEAPVALPAGPLTADVCLDPTRKHLLVLDRKAGTLSAVPTQVPGFEVDDTPLPIETELAFPDLQWSGWTGMNEKGQIVQLRPILLTHAGDGSNRVFVPTQHGVIHVFPNDQKATKTSVFLDLQDRCVYSDNQNEEGFLGLAFHPKFKSNGEFFVFYTPRKAKLQNVVSRFRVSKDDPNRADPNSEEEILRFTKPFWNHDGGTICFGPDGYLYVTHGDGGAANDPFNNGQNLKTLLGKVLRLDVDRKENGNNYAIPKDNPFVGKADVAPEIFAYGLRNVWRMAFDRQTGQLWAGEVGQNLYEEINIIRAGGNYGWKLRESLHPFSAPGVGPRSDLIDPIWEYHHDIGKSITGGVVYRGPRLPELLGHYLYADYVSGKIWALKYDEAKKRVTANRPIKDRTLPVLSFGEDEQGEAYLMTHTPTGKGLYRFAKSVAGK